GLGIRPNQDNNVSSTSLFEPLSSLVAHSSANLRNLCLADALVLLLWALIDRIVPSLMDISVGDCRLSDDVTIGLVNAARKATWLDVSETTGVGLVDGYYGDEEDEFGGMSFWHSLTARKGVSVSERVVSALVGLIEGGAIEGLAIATWKEDQNEECVKTVLRLVLAGRQVGARKGGGKGTRLGAIFSWIGNG
ncbi:hypothetical protein HDU76_001853, partial [Blyttiomyces sp. JEL0837]